MTKDPIIIKENSAFFRTGQIIESYDAIDNGVSVGDKFLHEDQYVVLNEKLSRDDEKAVREMIRQYLKTLLWNMYTKNSTILP